MNRFANLRIGHRLTLSFAGVVALIALMAALLLSEMHGVQSHAQEILGPQAERLRLANEWRQGILVNAERAAAMAQSSDPALATRFEPEMKKTSARISEIQKRFEAIETSEAGVAAQAQLAAVRKTYLEARKELLAGDNRNDAAKMQAFNTALSAYIGAATVLVDFEQSHGDTLGAEVLGTLAKSRLHLIVVATGCALVAMALGWLLTRGIVRPLSLARSSAERIAGGDLSRAVPVGGADEVGQLLRSLAAMQQSLRTLAGDIRSSADSIGVASAEVAAGNQDLSVRTEQMSANLQAAASSVEQIAHTMRQGAESAREADDLARRASGVAGEGGEAMGRVVSTMTTISESSSRIGEIVGVIDGIAFQTNILALNAAVEAARAGEQGRGFAVVAGEVRALAQRSATAAKEIKVLIDESVGRVAAGARQAQDAGRTIEAVVGDVQRVSSIISSITRAAGEQSQGIAEVNRAVSQLDQVTQQNAALVEESAAAAASLKDQSEGLSASARRFKLD